MRPRRGSSAPTTRLAGFGVAVLGEDGERTGVTLYLLNPDRIGALEDAASAEFEETLAVEIVDLWAFPPHSLQVSGGSTVTWVNNTDMAHTVTADDLAFNDSGLIEPRGSFHQTFDRPGTYRYTCGPHLDMTRVIVVGEAVPAFAVPLCHDLV